MQRGSCIAIKSTSGTYPWIPASTRHVSSSSPPRNPSSQFTFEHANRLSGRICMITGGTSGIGFAIAERFLQEGARRVVLVGRSHKRLLDAAGRLETSGIVAKENIGQTMSKNGTLITSSDRVSLLVGDVADAGSWMRELEKEMVCISRYLVCIVTRGVNNLQESIDILVNAAGISISSILPKTKPEDISQTLRANLEGAIFTSRALMRALIRNRLKNKNSHQTTTMKSPSKCIINISSLLALKAGTGAVPYAASKAGILGLTSSLAVEAAGSLKDVVVRSNVIVPGYIETPMIAGLFFCWCQKDYNLYYTNIATDFSESQMASLKDKIPVHRFGDPREVADAAVFLAQNEYANNCVLNLDGGLNAV